MATKKDFSSIWEKEHLQKMLKEPMGSPVELPEEEALQVILSAGGSRPDFPSGEEFVKRVRSGQSRDLGDSIQERLE